MGFADFQRLVLGCIDEFFIKSIGFGTRENEICLFHIVNMVFDNPKEEKS